MCTYIITIIALCKNFNKKIELKYSPFNYEYVGLAFYFKYAIIYIVN